MLRALVAASSRASLRMHIMPPAINQIGIFSVFASSLHTSLPSCAAAADRNLHPLANPTPTLAVEGALDIAVGPKGKNLPGKPAQGHTLNEYERLVCYTWPRCASGRHEIGFAWLCRP